MRTAFCRFRLSLTVPQLVVLAGVYAAAFLNLRFFRSVLETYPLTATNVMFVAALAIMLVCLHVFLLSLVAWRRTIKPLLAVLLPLAAATAYFIDTYSVIIDDVMVRNIVETNPAESFDLLSFRLVLYVVVLGLLPAVLLTRVELRPAVSRVRAVLGRVALTTAPLLLIAIVVMPFSSQFATFVREHHPLQKYANPIYPLYAVGDYVDNVLERADGPVESLGLDASLSANHRRSLVVMVVGETARADHFSLNGYGRDTNPRLSQENVISLNDFWSCGTSTSVSVPCMFSRHEHGKFDVDEAAGVENALDVLSHAGVNVLWRDNNSDSKGVALRSAFEDFRSNERNPACDTECRDIGMLDGLQAYVNAHAEGDVLVVLHQMGNHGPAYFKRYPPEFEVFKPVCRSVELETCTHEEIDNAYDNAIRYTDYFLSEVINFLKQNDANFDTAMLYVSDHGESLGEYGVYLHGLPYSFAPEAQKHVPAILWLGKGFEDVDFPALAGERNAHFTHANIFHTLLGFMNVQSGVYDATADILPHESASQLAHSEEAGAQAGAAAF